MQINKRKITFGALLDPVLKNSAKNNEIQENYQEQTHTFQGTDTSSTHMHSRIEDTHKPAVRQAKGSALLEPLSAGARFCLLNARLRS
jgi:hypothetical protein